MTKKATKPLAPKQPEIFPSHPFQVTITISGLAAFKGTVDVLALEAMTAAVQESFNFCDHVLNVQGFFVDVDTDAPGRSA